MTSSETELPYNYYTLPFCKPPEGIRKSVSAINPGTILMGSRIENSAYNFSMLVGGTARHAARSLNLQALCSAPLFSGKQQRCPRRWCGFASFGDARHLHAPPPGRLRRRRSWCASRTAFTGL